MEKAKIVVLGIGRMGKGIICRAVEEGFDVVAAVDSVESSFIGKDAGIVSGTDVLGVMVESAESLEEILDRTKPDVVIDFTNAQACFWNFKAVCRRGINSVIGTTGLSAEQIEGMEKDAKENEVGFVISPNMSVGVNIFWKLVREATRYLKDYDIEIIEKHHRFKKDAPSGTALKTAQIIAEEKEENITESAVYGRHGMMERRQGEIGIHAVRAGDIVGEHTALYGTLGERIEITHVAHSRDALINGVVLAVKFIVGKKGAYSMDDVIGI